MNFIQILLLVGLVILAVEKGYTFFKIKRNEDGQEPSSEHRKARNAFFWSLAVAVIYACIKLT